MLSDPLTGDDPAHKPTVLTLKQGVYLFACAVLCVMLTYCRSTKHGEATDLDYLIAYAVMVALFPWTDKGETPLPVSDTTSMRTSGAITEQVPETKPSRFYYLDNLKSLLTLIVVLHHISQGFAGGTDFPSFAVGNQPGWWPKVVNGFVSTNQGYFMPLFFFISGFFTPRSHARKGTREFVRDKLKRLGVPYLVWFFCLSPLVWYFIQIELHWPRSYDPIEGPPWFLKALIVFNMWYVVAPAPPLRLPLPSFLRVGIVGLLVGLLSGCFYQWNVTFLGIPLAAGFGSVPFDVLFFYAGCVAERDNWLASLKAWRKSQVVLLYGFAALLYAAVFSFAVLTMNVFDPPCEISPPHPLADAALPALPSNRRALAFSLDGLAPKLGLCGVVGLYTVVFSLAFLHFSSFCLNFTGPVCRFFNQAAYGVYVTHCLVWPIIQYAYLQVLKATTAIYVRFTYCNSHIHAYTWVPTTQLVLGFLFTAGLTNLILWPLMFFVRKLPGFNRVL